MLEKEYSCLPLPRLENPFCELGTEMPGCFSLEENRGLTYYRQMA